MGAAKLNVKARRIQQEAARSERCSHAQLDHPPEDRAVHTLAALVGVQLVCIDNVGNRQAYSPEWNGNLSISYERGLPDDLLWFAGADYLFQSDMFFDPKNDIVQQAYGLLNARLGVRFQKLELSLWGKNLADEVYYSYGFGVFGFSQTSSFAGYGLPRTLGATGKFRF